MSRLTTLPLTWTLVLLAAVTGCHPTQPFYFHNDGDLSHYLDRATDVEHPDVDAPSLAEVDQALAPLTISNPEFNEIWDLSLEECVHIALQNSKVIRNAGAIQANFGFSAPLIDRIAQGNSTAFDPAITESTTTGSPRAVNSNGSVFPPTGGIDRASNPVGVEDALSEFDAQPFASFQHNRTDRPNNSAAGLNFFQPNQFRQRDSDFLMSLSKKTASGAVFTARSRTDFTWNNLPANSRPIPGDWIQNFEVEGIFPLMRGRGAMINRIPIVLARINTDISIADFEAAVRNMLMDVETAYWDLHYSYRNLEAAKIGRDSALVTWKIIYEKWSKGVSPVQEEAQARGQYFQFRAAVETALRDVYSTETRIRWLMGLAATDGRLIRPKNEPSMARVEFDWQDIHAEALFRSTELRQQKWRLKQRELELISAKNQLLPSLNLTALYRWLGRGDELMNADRNGLNFPAPGSTAFDELFGGQYQEASVGVNFTPGRIGWRRELAGVRNAQLQIARTKAQLEEMELNLSHLLTSAIRDLDSNYLLAQTHFNRWVAAEKEVDSVEALYKGGKQTLDLVLDAQRRRAQAQTDYYRALTDYNKSLAFVHYRKGSLLEHNGIAMAEGPWPEKAYWDAMGHARERDSSYYLNYGFTRPSVVGRGPVEQATGTAEPRGKVSAGYVAEPEAMPEENAPPAAPPETDPVTSAPAATPRAFASGVRTGRKFDIQPAAAEEPAEQGFDWGKIGSSSGDGSSRRSPTPQAVQRSVYQTPLNTSSRRSSPPADQ